MTTDTFEEPRDVLDFRTTKCPLNFVKTRLALEKLPLGGVLEVWVNGDSESAINVPSSLQAEGHEILLKEWLAEDPTALRLVVKRLK